MRKGTLVLLLAAAALQALAANQVTIKQLEQTLAESEAMTDGRLAKELGDLELTERASAARLAQWEARAPGPRTKMALIALADASAFLDPPAEEIQSIPAPDLAAQRQMMARTVDYVGKTLPRLPNFYATRDTTRFEDTPTGYSGNETLLDKYQPLHVVGKSSATVLFRDGKEVLDNGPPKDKKQSPFGQGLDSRGEFGPILGIVIVDAARGKVNWSHWEQGTGGPRAVFRFAVPQDKSHYQVKWCCVTFTREFKLYAKDFVKLAGYHGEMAVDPETGAILRLVLEADLEPGDPIGKAGIVVEYGQVEIGGKPYICPVKSVFRAIAPAQISFQMQSSAGKSAVPQMKSLNDVAFVEYHLFRSETRILTAENPLPANNSRGGEAGGDNSAAITSPMQGSSNSTAAAETPAAAAQAENEFVVSLPEKKVAATPAPAEEGFVPGADAKEIGVTDAAGLPGTAAMATTAAPEIDLTLRTQARSVDVPVMAFDKQGHPVTNLNRADFEIDDDGDKLPIQSFASPASPAAVEAAVAVGPAGRPPAFGNRGANHANGGPGAGNDVTVLLIDGANLTFDELTYARGELLRFLKVLPAGERVGLYAMKARSFQILEEPAADHAALTADLTQWMPSGKDLAEVQEEDRHNTTPSISSGESGDPDRGALSILTGVARHLAEIPGHKSLVYVANDQALGGSSNTPSSADKKATLIEGAALRAQEEMNDAHVGMYALDASKPEDGTAAARKRDPHSAQGAMPEMIEATGGRTLSRAGDVAAELSGVAEDSRAAYLLSFTPDVPPDDQYHRLQVKLTSQRDIVLRYRTGYLYEREPATLEGRFRQTIWEPVDAGEVAITAGVSKEPKGATLLLNIAAADLDLEEQDGLWMDKLDIYVAARDDERQDAQVTGQTVDLKLQPATYRKLLSEGIAFNQPVEIKPETLSVRIVVVDENSGRMGSVTVPASAFSPPR